MLNNTQQLINAQTQLNAITGFPLGHTLSPQLHAKIYAELNLNAVMLAFPQEKIEAMISVMRTLPIQLLAVTIPHKQAVIEHLDHIDATAQKIGAVNTVINRNGKLYGYNTDVTGIEKALENIELKQKNVLILGAGGAARPLCYVLQKKHANVFCWNRTQHKSEELMKEFGGTALMQEELGTAKIDVIMNATPVGMHPQKNGSPFPKQFLHQQQTVFDLIYNPAETQLLKDAKSKGATTINGLPMLIAQALEQVKLWSGKELSREQKEQLKQSMHNLLK